MLGIVISLGLEANVNSTEIVAYQLKKQKMIVSMIIILSLLAIISSHIFLMLELTEFSVF